MELELKHGDCLDKLKDIPDNSIDSIVTDPPYGLSFMNKKWDYDVPSTDIWIECLRVLKPGGHLLSFSGSRTYHRMAVRIEDAGFEIRDQIMWVYGSGFPKSHNIGKAVDKLQGNEREVLGENPYKSGRSVTAMGDRTDSGAGMYSGTNKSVPLTKGTSEWEGWGTALKPAHEPIVLARKPLSEKTVAENVLRWGTGGINIDESRIGTDKIQQKQYDRTPEHKGQWGNGSVRVTNNIITETEGRWPANIIFDEEAGQVLDQQSGISKGKVGMTQQSSPNNIYNGFKSTGDIKVNDGITDKGGASRYFYCPKASKKDRNEGLKSYVELFTSTIKIVYYTKDNLWEKEDQKTILVDMDTSLQKVIEEYGVQLKEDLKWNTGSYGNYIMDQLKKDLIFTTGMETNSIMILETLNLLIEKNTRIYIQELLGGMVKDIKFVKDVEQKNTVVNITLQNKDGYWQNVNLVELNEVWNINTVQGKSSHPTVKPTALMLYLIKLVTPIGGTVLDCFLGSGSTGKAAIRGGFNFVGIEREEEYIKIAEARIKNELNG